MPALDSTVDNLSNTTPAAPSGKQNVAWQADPVSNDPRNISAYPQPATGSLEGTIVIAEDLGGTADLPQVVGIQGHLIDGGPTDGDVLKYSAGSGKWEPTSLSSTPNTSVVGITIDGGGSVPATGIKGFIQIPYGCTITGWTIIADQSGSCSIGVKKSTFAGFPTTGSIVASAPPNLSSQQNATSTTLTGWTTTINAGDVLEFDLNSVTTCTRITLELQLSRT